MIRQPFSSFIKSVSPCLRVESIERELEFLAAVFNAEIEETRIGIDGNLERGRAWIGGAMIVLLRTPSTLSNERSTVFLHAEDVDATYKRAIDEGATPITEPSMSLEVNREAWFRDPQGNTWWIVRESHKLSDSEGKRRLKQQRRTRM